MGILPELSWNGTDGHSGNKCFSPRDEIQRRSGHFTDILSQMIDEQRQREIAELSAQLSRGASDFARLATIDGKC
jgi:hypothetical protein